MINVINGDDFAFNTVAFGPPNTQTVNYFREQFDNLDTSLFNNQNFVQDIYNTYEKNYSDEAIARARELLNQNDIILDPNFIYTANTLTDLQTAQGRMQYLNMANPVVKDLYNQQRCDGYSDTYVDPFPDTVGESDPYYQLVTDGLVFTLDSDKKDEDGLYPSFEINKTFGTFDEPDYLTFDEQVAMLDNWELINTFISKGKDPTSIYDSDL